MSDGELERGGRALDRLIYFSDAVFAIAMTLLVLDIPKPPQGVNLATFLAERTAQGHLLAYVISFWVIALYWMAHHRLFRVVNRFDQGVVQLNLLLLFFVAFLPYPSALLGEHVGSSPDATIFYAVCVSAVGAASTALVWYTVFHRKFTVALRPRLAAYYVYRGLVVPVVFLASIPVALVNKDLAQTMWLLTFILPFVAGRIVDRAEARDAEAAGS